MHRLSLLGLNHTTAPLEVRERLAFDAEGSRAAIEAFRGKFNCEVVLLSTCNRVELYCGGSPTALEMIQFLADNRGIPAEDFAGMTYQKNGRAVVEHLFSVAASLDSMVLGETQILGQVRQAYDAAHALAATGPLLNPLFQRAVAVGKEVLSTTSLGEGRLSVASVAVDLARGIFDSFADKTVLSIGAGKMSHLVLQNLSALNPGRLMICNRDGEKAGALAGRFGGESVAFDDLMSHLAVADIVVSSTGSPQPILTRKIFDQIVRLRRWRPVFLIDIAMPRDVEAAVGELDSVFLYNIDDLQKVVATTRTQRSAATSAAEIIVAEHVKQFSQAYRVRELGPVIDTLYRRYHALAQEELDRTLGRLGEVTPEERAHLEEFARRVVNKLLHDPIRTLRHADGAHQSRDQYLHAMQMLFNLSPTDENESKNDPPAG
ncbi:MAG TPA: glutamyl-tRNA reductase [Tepidisphaeraceae bacterium]|nr:glutamyl-tRNA reductase [Tepidisphaeraceae bacterium]